MTITICGSMKFAKQMFEVKNRLEQLNHKVHLPKDCELFIDNDSIKENVDFLLKGDYIQSHFDKIEKSNSILVLNYKKNNIEGYIGGNTLMEMAVSKHLKKKIYFLNKIPHKNDLGYATEIEGLQPVVINSNLELIKL